MLKPKPKTRPRRKPRPEWLRRLHALEYTAPSIGIRIDNASNFIVNDCTFTNIKNPDFSWWGAGYL
jgi:hypothetical protein